MASAKMETAAERYRRIRKEKEAAEDLFDVECPSGMVFKCRKVSVPFLVSSGMLPLHLVELMAKALEVGSVSAEDAFKALPMHQMIQSIEFASKVVKHVCVEPRIVDEPTGPNDISPDEVMLEDYNFLVSWAMGGGDEAARLENFRTE